MARSSYDLDGDGRCDTEACAHVPVPVAEAGPMWALAETLKDDLHPIGIDLDLQPIGDAGVGPGRLEPRESRPARDRDGLGR